MKLLLDSHVFVWWLTDSMRLNSRVRHAIQTGAVSISLASCWELSSKRAAGRLELEGDLFEQAAADNFDVIPILADDVRAASALPLIHRDPFDRMLVAQAQRRALVMVTVDPLVKRYGGAVLPA